MTSLPLDTEVELVIKLARNAADSEPCPFVDTDHLLLGLMRIDYSSTARIMPRIVVDSLKTNRVFASLMPARTHPSSTAKKYSVEFLQSISNAQDIAQKCRASAVTAKHVLAGLLEVSGSNRATLLLTLLGVNPHEARQLVRNQLPREKPPLYPLEPRSYWKKYRKISRQWRQQKIFKRYNCALPSFRSATYLHEYIATMSPYRRSHWKVLLNAGIEAYLAWREQLQSPDSPAPPELKNTTL